MYYSLLRCCDRKFDIGLYIPDTGRAVNVPVVAYILLQYNYYESCPYLESMV